MTASTDPILEQRNVVRRRTSLALRAGGILYLLATILFFWAVATTFSGSLTMAMTICLFAGSILLAPAMVAHYGVKAADRADRDDSW